MLFQGGWIISYPKPEQLTNNHSCALEGRNDTILKQHKGANHETFHGSTDLLLLFRSRHDPSAG